MRDRKCVPFFLVVLKICRRRVDLSGNRAEPWRGVAGRGGAGVFRASLMGLIIRGERSEKCHYSNWGKV